MRSSLSFASITLYVPYLFGRLSEQMPAAAKPNAKEVEGTFRVLPSLYLIGSMERGVTIYSQQVRAHNLAWALCELQRGKRRKLKRVAVVGGGIAGLTLAACLLCLDDTLEIILFERFWDLCPFQQGADVRWVHPRIYEWPAEGSRAPSASLPVLDWTEGRGSDVGRTILREFSRYVTAFAAQDNRLSVYLGLRNFKIDAAESRISWIGHKAIRGDEFFNLHMPEGNSDRFDAIVLATGFGTETTVSGYRTESYWRNEQLAQPMLDGSQRRYLISGFGDGALVDLCRLTIERFRQDTIVYELFDGALEDTELRLSEMLNDLGRDHNVFDLFQENQNALLKQARERLARRIRKDTRVTLHLLGRRREVSDFPSIFGRNSSFLHRLIAYMLYRCGAFSLDFSELSDAVHHHNVDPANVLCRYGANTVTHLESLFVDPKTVRARLAEMQEAQQQIPERFWSPGAFPHYSNR